MNTPRFVLASASPARRQLLQSVGISPVIQPSDYDESQAQQSDARELVEFLALRKAETVMQQLQEPALVLGCDSVLELDGQIHGKPKGKADAISRWQKMRGGVGHLYTGHALFNFAQQAQVCYQMTAVHFAQVSDLQIEAYVSTQEPLNCAGSFALDGYGGLFIDQIIGCHSNVIGLSLPLLRRMLAQFNYNVTDFWKK